MQLFSNQSVHSVLTYFIAKRYYKFYYLHFSKGKFLRANFRVGQQSKSWKPSLSNGKECPKHRSMTIKFFRMEIVIDLTLKGKSRREKRVASKKLIQNVKRNCNKIKRLLLMISFKRVLLIINPTSNSVTFKVTIYMVSISRTVIQIVIRFLGQLLSNFNSSIDFKINLVAWLRVLRVA